MACVGGKRGRLAEIAHEVIVIADEHYGSVEDCHMGICHMLCYAFTKQPELAPVGVETVGTTGAKGTTTCSLGTPGSLKAARRSLRLIRTSPNPPIPSSSVTPRVRQSAAENPYGKDGSGV